MVNQPKPAKRKHVRKWANPTKKLKVPQANQTQVLALKMIGKSQRKIAAETDINRETVARILSQNEFDDLVRQLRCRIIKDLAHKAIDCVEKELKKGNAKVALQVLLGLKVLSPRTQVEMKRAEPGERDYADTKVQFYYKFGRWPTEAECLEFEKTIECEPLIKESAKKNVQ